MADGPTTPVVQDLRLQPLSALVDLTQAVDGDGFFFKQGDLMEMDADKKVKKLTASGTYIGQAKTSLHENQAPSGLDAEMRIGLLTRFNQLTKMNCTGTVAAGGIVVASATAGKVKAATALASTVDSGATPVTSSAANGAIITTVGSTPPEIPAGVCWIGGTDTEIQVLT